MRWEKVSVIAEVISAIAVVVSLLYLSGQIREGNALAEAESVHAINSGFTEVEMVFATSAKLPDIYRTVLAGGELDAEERVRFVACLRPISSGLKTRTGELKRSCAQLIRA